MRGDIYQPMYCFEVADGSNIASQASQNYPNSYVLRDSDDNYWHVDMVDNKLDIKFNGNEFLEITANLDTTIGGNETKSIGGNETRTISGSRTTNVATSDTKTVPSFTINASSSVTINSPSVSVNSGTVTVSGGDVIADGISLKGHTHSHGDPAGITSPPL
jgi:phage baseplate assembly protein gpV